VKQVTQRQQLEAQLKAARKACSQAKRLERELAELDEVATGEVPAPEIALAIRRQSFSYGIVFLRRKGDEKTSQRRFSSAREANQHGTRFTRIHRHRGFYIVRVSQRANAWINWTTGKTNPVV
jgi:hypothetical protein